MNANGMDVEIERMRGEGVENSDIGIYVEERVEFIHSRISLRPLLNGLHNFDKMKREYESRALTRFGKLLLSKMDQMADRLKSKALLLNGHNLHKLNGRNKRAIEFIGNLISKAFGNPGPEEWRKNNANIAALKKAIELQRLSAVSLFNNIDHDRHDIEKQNKVLKQISVELFKSENAVDQLQTELLDLQSYLELDTMITAIDEILESLFEIKSDAKFGRCNLRGMNQVFLVDNLRTIESNKLGIAPVFASWEWENYYKHEMCTLAIEGDDLWVTLRIPIIRPSEKLYRIIPSSSFVWIRQAFDSYGIDISFFKEKNHDIYMILKLADYELCSTLGTTRVCNVRKTLFKEQLNFVVPLQLSLDRIVLISNSTRNDSLQFTAKCNDTIRTLNTSAWSALTVPPSCSLKNKYLVIAEKLDIEFVSTSIELEIRSPTPLGHRQLEYPTKSRMQINVSEYKNESFSKEFRKYDEQTKTELDRISLNHDQLTDELRTVKIGGVSTSACFASILGIVLLVIIWKKCKTSRMNGNGLNVNLNVEAPTKHFDEPSQSEDRHDNVIEIPKNECTMNDSEKIGTSINKFK